MPNHTPTSEVSYRSDAPIAVDQFIGLLRESTLAARRPVDDRDCIQGMLDHADLTITAWIGARLVGVARSVTDFHYCCYLSDLAVAGDVQRCGVGRGLIAATQARLGPKCKVVLLAAPDAVDYYPKLGFDQFPQAWVIPSRRAVR